MTIRADPERPAVLALRELGINVVGARRLAVLLYLHERFYWWEWRASRSPGGIVVRAAIYPETSPE